MHAQGEALKKPLQIKINNNFMIKKRKKRRTCLTKRIIYIKSTFNKRRIKIKNLVDNTISWVSAKNFGFKESRKKASLAA